MRQMNKGTDFVICTSKVRQTFGVHINMILSIISFYTFLSKNHIYTARLRRSLKRVVIPLTHNSRWQSTVCRANSAVVPVAHVISPYHCFELFYAVILGFSVSAVKQFFFHSCPHTFATSIVMASASCTVHALN